MKKIKIFLAGYINSSNAQNLNCLALSKYLDKSLFDVYTMSLYSGNLEIDKKEMDTIKIFNCFKPFDISRRLAYCWGIYKSDVVYLPKGEEIKLARFLVRFLNKKSFKTVEGIFDEKNMESVIPHFGSYENFIDSFKHFNKVYSITKFLKEYNLKAYKIKSESKILYLGTDIDVFLNKDKEIKTLINIIYIGRLFKRKGIYDLLELAKNFPLLTFHIIGEGSEENNMKEFIKINKLKNIKLYGKLNHTELSTILKNMDLHLFPSRSEGFPKVTLETAASGVPSLVYSDYGASEWIKDHHDGFVVDNLDEMKKVVQELIDNATLLKNCSKNAIDLAKRFDWKILVKDWEEEIIKIYEN